MDPRNLYAGLAAVGELLRTEGERVGVVVVGGATLNLIGVVERTTRDVDVIALVHRDAAGAAHLARAEPFPEPLARAIRTVARDFGLDADWMSGMVGRQWSQGLPPGIEQDLTWRRYGGLDVALVGRRTLTALKLFATVDCGPASVHMQDLIALAPSAEELWEAAGWVRTQDAAPEFPALVEQAVEHVLGNR